MELPEKGFAQLYQDGPDKPALHHLLTEETLCFPVVEGGWSLQFDQAGAGWISSPAQQVWVAELLDCRVARLDSGCVVAEQGSQQPLSEFERARVGPHSLQAPLGWSLRSAMGSSSTCGTLPRSRVGLLAHNGTNLGGYTGRGCLRMR